MALPDVIRRSLCREEHLPSGRCVFWVWFLLLIIMLHMLCGGYSAIFGLSAFCGSVMWCKHGHDKVAMKVPRIRLLHFWLCILFCCGRVGEAANPGPVRTKLGVCNPTGMGKKLDVASDMCGETWVVSETHLTKMGIDKFRKGLRSLRSSYTGIVHGAPCKQLRSEHSGQYSGVMLMHKGPARALNHKFPRDSFETGRIQVAGYLAHEVWIQIGMIYGVPKSAKHRHPAHQTDVLLEQLVDRIACQSSGPRVIAGDINHSEQELSQLRRLRSLGFREVQEVALHKWGQIEQATGRGTTKLDQIWVSSELLSSICQVEVHRDRWADHATVEVEFEFASSLRVAEVWHKPQVLQWPSGYEYEVGWDPGVDPTLAYASLWTSLEKQAVLQNDASGQQWFPQQLGRGQTLAPRSVHLQTTPLKPSRRGELEPEFLGVARRHSQFFRVA